MNELRPLKTKPDGSIQFGGTGLKRTPPELVERVDRLLKLGEERGYKKPCEFVKTENQ